VGKGADMSKKKTGVPAELTSALIWELKFLEGAAMHLKPLVSMVNRRLVVGGFAGGHSERAIRRAIGEAIKDENISACIGSGQDGYYIITNLAGLRAAQNELICRANELHARSAQLAKNYMRSESGKVQTRLFGGGK